MKVITSVVSRVFGGRYMKCFFRTCLRTSGQDRRHGRSRQVTSTWYVSVFWLSYM